MHKISDHQLPQYYHKQWVHLIAWTALVILYTCHLVEDIENIAKLFIHPSINFSLGKAISFFYIFEKSAALKMYFYNHRLTVKTQVY